MNQSKRERNMRGRDEGEDGGWEGHLRPTD